MHMSLIYGADKGSMSGAVKLCFYFLLFFTFKKVAVWIFYFHESSRFGRKNRICLLFHWLKIEVWKNRQLHLNKSLEIPHREPSPSNRDHVWNRWISLELPIFVYQLEREPRTTSPASPQVTPPERDSDQKESRLKFSIEKKKKSLLWGWWGLGRGCPEKL